MDKVSQILAETARDLTLAHVAGKPLDRVVSEGAARIAAHYAQPLASHMQECETCRGNGYRQGIRCGTCHGAGQIEVWTE